jgi:hypothetical protein
MVTHFFLKSHLMLLNDINHLNKTSAQINSLRHKQTHKSQKNYTHCDTRTLLITDSVTNRKIDFSLGSNLVHNIKISSRFVISYA